MTTPFDPAHKLLRHPAALAALQAGQWRAPPVGVEISPTNDCNAKCPWCFYVSSEYKQHHSAEELDYDVLCGLIDSLDRCGVLSVTWTGGGEPSVYSHIDEAVSRCHERRIKQGMFTNAYRAIEQPELLDWVRITVTERFVLTKHVRDYCRATEVGVNFNVTNDNQAEMRRLVDESIDAGVRYFQVRPALADRWDLQREVKFPDWLLGYVDDGAIEVETTWYKWRDYMKPHGYKTCHGHRLVPFVWHDGDVAVCAYHHGREEFTFGNLNRMTWEEVWGGERRCRMIADGVAVVRDCQHCCKLHEVNKALSAEPRHEDFI